MSILSRREREVLDQLVTGKSTKAIAAGLGLSPRTVETHRSRLLKHLRVTSTAHAIRIAVEAGL
ncbi:LuxR family transcriptional regulator (plasmid) [Sphingobium baderi]|nr:LuxR family transcriptional regulator [Sphingobium baderi]